MQKFKIHKLGPIEDCEFELSDVLVLTGKQASGKSTVAKLCNKGYASQFFADIWFYMVYGFKHDLNIFLLRKCLCGNNVKR